MRQSIVDEQSLITFELCRLYSTESAVILNTDTKTGGTGTYLENRKQLTFLPEKRKENYDGKRVLMEREHLPMVASAALESSVRDLSRIDAGVNHNHTGVVGHMGGLANAVLTMVPGELYASTLYWNNSVEDTVIRISTLLDDWLTTHLIGVNTETETGGRSENGPGGSGRDAVEGGVRVRDQQSHDSPKSMSKSMTASYNSYDAHSTVDVLSAAPSPVRKSGSGAGLGGRSSSYNNNNYTNNTNNRESQSSLMHSSIQSTTPFSNPDPNPDPKTPLLFSKKLLRQKQDDSHTQYQPQHGSKHHHYRPQTPPEPPIYPFKRSPLITQELLLYTSSMLMKYLSMDSSKVMVCVCVYIYVYMHICMCMCMYVCVCMCLYVSLFVHVATVCVLV